MKKHLTLTLLALILSVVTSFASGPLPIFGAPGVCTGDTTLLFDSTAGGTWSSSNTAIATVDPATGLLAGIAPGTATITYTLGSYVTYTITVAPAPGPISGVSSLCVGSTYTFTNSVSGGTWSTTSSYVATVGSSSGVVTGAHAGSVNIYYMTAAGCYTSSLLNVIDVPRVKLMGASSVCIGGTIALSDSSGASGTWTSSNTGVATVSGGTVTGVAAGTATISFTVTNSCGTTTGTKVVTITSTTTPSAITGTTTVMATYSTYLADATPGGVWSSSNTAIATVSSTGVVTGVSAGTASITYTMAGCSGASYVVTTITVTGLDGISGHVLFSGTSYTGLVKVWLITYNPTTLDLQAYDSTYCYSSGSSAFYSFTGVPTDSFRIKAATYDSASTATTGYQPTYHTSSYYWYTANVLPHVSGTMDINQDITMMYGTLTPGPGFIGGNVSTGANKGTGGAGAAGLSILLLDGSGNILAHTTTDASGAYGFSGLPLGTYQVFPEALNYITTPYATSLVSGAATVSDAGFIQHTISYKIDPAVLLLNQNQVATTTLNVFPNPSAGIVNVSWNAVKAEKATVTVSDMAGRQVYQSVIDMTQGAARKQLDLGTLTNGAYMMNIESASVHHNSKITVAH